ncbi:MAG: diguanylate cyclase [Comamonadaceae bacterium]|nr:MAG: diguanylate cyclase [Comamonadaceae bacterium]
MRWLFRPLAHTRMHSVSPWLLRPLAILFAAFALCTAHAAQAEPQRIAAAAATATGPAPGAATITTIRLDDASPDLDAEGLTLAWKDAAARAGIEQVAGTATIAKFRAMAPSAIHALGTQDALWLHLRVERARGARREWLLEIPQPLLDAASLFQLDEHGRWLEQSAGDTIAVAAWSEAGRYPTFRLDLPPGQVRDLYIRIRHVTPLTVPLRLASESSHDNRIQVEYLLLGIVFGALCFLILACVAQGWVHRDVVYGWYAAYAGITTLAVASYTGVAGHMLWPYSGAWADMAQGSLALLAGGSALLFVRHLSGMIIRYPRLDRVIQWMGVVGLLLAFGYTVMGRAEALTALGAYLAVSVVLNVWVSLLAWRRGDEVGPWMMAAYVPLAVAVMLALVRVFGGIPASWLTQYGVVIAMAIEVPLLLVALNIRSRERHGADIREQALSSQDALTGLLAPHLYQDRLRQVVSRYKRDRESAAIIFIDLVNYQRIKAAHGQAVAEQSLLRCVIKLRRLLRDVDTISRIGEARFGLIMEGVSSRAVVTDRVARLIASGLMPLKGLKPEVTLQFHSAAALLKERTLAASDLSDALMDILAGMSSRSRRPIRFLEPEVTRPMPLEPDSQRDAEEDAEDSSLPRPA